MLPSVCRRIFDAFFSGDASGARGRNYVFSGKIFGAGNQLAYYFTFDRTVDFSDGNHSDRKRLCKSSKCGRISAGRSISGTPSDLAVCRAVYGCTFNKHMDFAEPGMYLRSGGRISSEKIHGTVHL